MIHLTPSNNQIHRTSWGYDVSCSYMVLCLHCIVCVFAARGRKVYVAAYTLYTDTWYTLALKVKVRSARHDIYLSWNIMVGYLSATINGTISLGCPWPSVAILFRIMDENMIDWLIDWLVILQGSYVSAAVDGKTLYSRHTPVTSSHGFVGLGTDNFQHAYFDDFSIS